MPNAPAPPQLVLDLRPPDPTRGKRWNGRRVRWVAPDRPLFRPAGFAVDLAPRALARRFVEAHHYAGSVPPTYEHVGLWRSTGGPRGPQLVGVASFTVPNGGTASCARYHGAAGDAACDLGRFVLLDEIGYNGESWMIPRALGVLAAARPHMRGVTSYADPVEWKAPGGVLLKRGHVGAIYRASGQSVYAGRATPRTLLMGPDGRPLNGRNMTKLRKMERGWEYVARGLVALGAPARAAGEAPRAWLDRVLAAPGFVTARVRHPGNHVYLFPLDEAARRALLARHAGAPPPPRSARPAAA